jgi:hypothetical protein
VTVNWGTVLTSVISGVVVAWPGVAVTVWLSHQRLKQHIAGAADSQTKNLVVITDDQTRNIQNLTDQQTEQLLKRRWWRRWA